MRASLPFSFSPTRAEGLITRRYPSRVLMRRPVVLIVPLLVAALAGCVEPPAPDGRPSHWDLPENPNHSKYWNVTHTFSGQGFWEASVEYFPGYGAGWLGNVTMDFSGSHSAAAMFYHQVYFEGQTGRTEPLTSVMGEMQALGLGAYASRDGQGVTVPTGASWPDFIGIAPTPYSIDNMDKWDEPGWLRLAVAYILPPGSSEESTIHLTLKAVRRMFGNESEETRPDGFGLYALSEGDFEQTAGTGVRAVGSWTHSVDNQVRARFTTTRATWFQFYALAQPTTAGPNAGEGDASITNETGTWTGSFGGTGKALLSVDHHEAGANDWEFALSLNGNTDALLAYAEFPGVLP